jgi:hypothetical protein
MWRVSISAIGCADGAKGIGAVGRAGALGSWTLLAQSAPAAGKGSSCPAPLPSQDPITIAGVKAREHVVCQQIQNRLC